MAVDRKCLPDADKLTATVNLTAGQNLLYEVTPQGAQPIFSLVDQHGHVVLSDADQPQGSVYRVRWPGTHPVHFPDDLNHVLGLHFIAAVEYQFRATVCAADNQPISVRKNCTYSSTTPTDKWFVPLRIFTL